MLLSVIEFPFNYIPPKPKNPSPYIVLDDYDPVDFAFGYNSLNDMRVEQIVPCYFSFLMSWPANWPTYFKCLRQDACVLDYKTFDKAFNLFKSYNIILDLKPDRNCELIINNGNKYNKFKLYNTLCLYRWCNTNPKLIYELLYRIDELKNINFWRIFHYVTGKFVANYQHNIVHVDKKNYTDIRPTVAARKVFANFDKFENSATYGYTGSFLQTIYDPSINVTLNQPEDILNEKYESYYND